MRAAHKMATKVRTLIHARHVVPVSASARVRCDVLHNHSLAIGADGSIVDVLPTPDAEAAYHAEEVVNLKDHVLIPGLVNCHTHSAMTLLRGYADDLNLMDWLQKHIWPAEQKWADNQFCQDGTELAIAEMFRSGTTCFNDMYFFPEDSAAVADRSGIRAVIGAPVMMFPTQYASDPAEYFSKGVALVNKYVEHGRVQVAIAPHAPYTVTDEQLEKIRVTADEHGSVVHMHVHETATEVSDAVKANNERPLARLAKHGLLHEKFLAVHMTQLNDEEIALMAKSKAGVVHCPESNTKLASGFCPVHKLLTAGVNVCLGTDGAASNNDLDMFGEMRTAALLGKLEAGDAAALSADQVLRMATINGARALGLEDVCGSLEKGKRADITAVRLGSIEASPVYNVVSHLLYSVGRESVTDVWVDGLQVLQGRQLKTLDEAAIIKKAQEWGDKIRSAPRPDKEVHNE